MTEKQELDFEMEPEYDFSNAHRNPYAARIQASGNAIVVIDSDLVELFPDSEAVNTALRSLSRLQKAHPQHEDEQPHAKAS